MLGLRAEFDLFANLRPVKIHPELASSAPIRPDCGFRAVIAPGFADIFYNNSLKNGFLPTALPQDKLQTICTLRAIPPCRSLSTSRPRR